jgi:AcrR family transcriptional regulator
MPDKSAPIPPKDQDDGLGIKRFRQIKNKDLVRKRRAQILEAARRLFTKKGFAVTTIQDICEESGVNPGSLYDYVQNKDDILRLLFKEMMGDSAAEREKFFPIVDINDLTSLRKYLRDLINHSWSFRPDILSLAYQETRFLDRQTKREVMASDHNLIEVVATRLEKGLGRKVDPQRLRVAASLLVFILAFKPLKGWTTREIDPDMVLEVTVDLFIKALGAL